MPEIRLHLADEAHDLWLKTEDELQQIGLQPPFWAFAWAGGQGLARHVLNHPDCVSGKSVLDFASGSGLVGIAAAMAGASSVLAVDIDPWAKSAIALNAEVNGVELDFSAEDLVGHSIDQDVVLAGDVFYDREFAARITVWFDELLAQGKDIIVGDPGRYYLPKRRLEALGTYEVPVTRALEDSEIKRTTVWRFLPSE